MYKRFMRYALKEAQKAFNLNEVPVGAVIVKDNKIISSGHNLRESTNNSLAHAEIIAINKACEVLSTWRLSECDLYVTLEPCPMCMGAAMNSRIKTIIYGANDTKYGSFMSAIEILSYNYNHKPNIINGILDIECSSIMKDFFKKLRYS